MAQVVLDSVVKRYGEVTAVNNVSLTIKDQDFVALVGPSGCGKTTTLNLVAGLIDISEGNIYIGDRAVNTLDPKDRDIAMVFQNYALYPSKTVRANLAFPLEMRKTPKAEIGPRVQTAARILGIEHLLDRRPRELSGGQQQRVALGRALVRDPKAFLMDEPLSNLDAKLRVQTRAELKRLHQELGATVLYVTHDQMEAMTMADKIAVMRDGVVQQYGAPEEIFNRPVNMFVAGFIGSPPMNFLPGKVGRAGGVTTLLCADWSYPLPGAAAHLATTASSEDVVLGVRNRHIRLAHEATPGAIPARIYTVEPTGDITYVHVRIGEAVLVAGVDPAFRGAADEPVWLDFDPEHLYLFDARTQETLRAA